MHTLNKLQVKKNFPSIPSFISNNKLFKCFAFHTDMITKITVSINTTHDTYWNGLFQLVETVKERARVPDDLKNKPIQK